MRRLISFTALLLVPAIAAAQGEAPKPDTTKKSDAVTHIGNWSGSVSTEQGNQEVWLAIKKDGDKLSGTAGSQMGETPLYDVSIKGDTLSAGATLSTPNGNFDLGYTLILKNGSLSGSIDLNIQGQKMSLPVAFKKAP